MPDMETLLAFSAVTVVLVATPGPGVLYVVGRSFGRSRRDGFASMFGVESAELVYVLSAAAGVSALLAASGTALDVLRYVGAAYLVAIGIYEWRKEPKAVAIPPVSGQHLFLHGFLVQILNPKVAVFFVAYFPQFVNPNAAITPQILLLGAIYISIASAVDSAYVLLSSFAGRRMAGSAHVRRRIARFGALTCIGLGVYAALSGQRAAVARA
jgi:threonine/homoserine/homoserine lactone efflux protein